MTWWSGDLQVTDNLLKMSKLKQFWLKMSRLEMSRLKQFWLNVSKLKDIKMPKIIFLKVSRLNLLYIAAPC